MATIPRSQESVSLKHQVEWKEVGQWERECSRKDRLLPGEKPSQASTMFQGQGQPICQTGRLETLPSGLPPQKSPLTSRRLLIKAMGHSAPFVGSKYPRT